MNIRIFNIACACSPILVALLLVAWPIAEIVYPTELQISVTHGWRVGIHSNSGDARIDCFNQRQRYCGGIIAGATPKGVPCKVKFVAFGDVLGIYLRGIGLPPFAPNSPMWWTLSLSFVYPMIVGSILPAVWFVRHRRRNDAKRGFEVLPPKILAVGRVL